MNADKNRQIEYYQNFFDDQIREVESEQKTMVMTPIRELLRNEEVSIGFVDHVNAERGHVIINFFRNRAPRLKMLKSVVVIKKAAREQMGNQFSEWNCSLLDFMRNDEFHSASSEILPLYYLRRDDPDHDYVGCSSVSMSLFQLMMSLTEKGIHVPVIIYTSFPPVEYFRNLSCYLGAHSEDDELLMKPKMAYEDWHPVELSYDSSNESAIADTVMRTLDDEGVCILQGPPGSGKSYTIAQIAAHYLNEGKTVCATTMANKGLMELAQQPPLKGILSAGRIAKTNLSADEKKSVKTLKQPAEGLAVPSGEMLCATNYVLSFAFSDKYTREHGSPSYDLVIIEEASQAFLTSIIGFKSLGKKCLIVGDPMQLPPIVVNPKKSDYLTWNVAIQADGLRTFAQGSSTKAFRITTTFRLTEKSAELTGLFYDNRFRSVRREMLDYSKSVFPFFPAEGGVLYHETNDFTNGICSETSLKIIEQIVNDLEKNYPERSLAIISPFRDTVKQLQKMFLTDTKISDLTVETIDRIQGITVDYAILYIPGRNPGFALDERRFNVATSRSRSTTFILSDIPLSDFHSLSPKVAKFLSGCRKMGKEDLTERHYEEKIDVSSMYEKGESCYSSKDYAGALKWFRDAAGHGNAEAQNWLGDMYYDGDGVQEDYSEAVKWYKEAAIQGSAEAQNSLGFMYQQGQGVSQDYSKAVTWYRKAAKQGLDVAQCNLGEMYRDGLGVKQNFAEALKLFRKAAEQGYSDAQNNLGDMYCSGQGVNENYDEAFEWYKKSAEQGNADAQYNLGEMYEQAFYYLCNGMEFYQSDAEAVRWYRRAASQGHLKSQKRLGDMLERGSGVERDSAESVKWYRAAAEQGDTESQTHLGDIYSGKDYWHSEVSRDFTEAAKWYRCAAENGYAEAQENLGDMYYCGTGVPQDYAEAAKLYQNASCHRRSSSLFRLCSMYLHGQGVKQDYPEAAKWYEELFKFESSSYCNEKYTEKVVKWFRDAAEQGVVFAQKVLGDIYYAGKGIQQNYSMAVQCYREAGEQGDLASQRTLARMYRFGENIARDYDEALKWYRKAASQGDMESAAELGDMYYEGDEIPQNYKLAEKWYLQAAEQGDSYSQSILGDMYSEGEGVKQDYAEAAKWYQKAAEQGDKDAKKSLDKIHRRLQRH